MMSEYKRLHPISAVASFIKQLKELIIPFVAIGVLGRGEKSSFWEYMPLIAIAVTLVFVLAAGIIKWLRFTYRLEDGELKMEYGLFVKKKRYIPFDRIQSLNFSEGILHRPFGLVKVKVETAGSTDTQQAEAELTAIPKEEAKELEDIIYREKNKGKSVQNTSQEESPAEDIKEVKQEAKVLYKMSVKDILIMASTSGGIGVIISGVLIFLSQFGEFIPYEAIFNELEEFVRSGILFVSVMVFAGLLVAWILSIGWTLIVYADFTVRLKDENIIITRGLLEKKQITIPLNRIQGIRIVENIIRQPLGFATIQIESAGGSVLDKDSKDIKLIPLISKREVKEILTKVFPDYHIAEDFHVLPKRSLIRYLIRSVFWVIPITIAASIAFWPYGLLGGLLFIPLGFWGYIHFKDAGWNIENNQLSLRYRRLVKQTLFLKKNRIQALDRKESWWQDRKELGSLHTTIKSGALGYSSEIKDLDTDDLHEIYKWFSQGNEKKKAPSPTITFKEQEISGEGL
jgi:putative membrane protein